MEIEAVKSIRKQHRSILLNVVGYHSEF